MIHIREDWEEVKVGVMLDLLRVKFADARLRDMLDATGERELVHGSLYPYPGLEFWGALLKRKGVEGGFTWEGFNTLGTLLDEVRG